MLPWMWFPSEPSLSFLDFLFSTGYLVAISKQLGRFPFQENSIDKLGSNASIVLSIHSLRFIDHVFDQSTSLALIGGPLLAGTHALP